MLLLLLLFLLPFTERNECDTFIHTLPSLSASLLLTRNHRDPLPLFQAYQTHLSTYQDSITEFMESKWQDLPVELLVQILSLVDDRTVIVACGVCTGWRDAIALGILELSFSWCNKNISKLVKSVAPKFRRLQACHLWNSRSYLTDEAVKALAVHCHELRDVDLSKGTRITDDSLTALAHGCRRLEKLNLSGCTNISGEGLTYLAEHCHYLRNLNLCGCNNAGSDQALLALAKNCVSLEVLNLGWCEKITDVGVTGLASWCSDIRNIDLCGCVLITDRSVIALADKCHYLRVLGLYSCLMVTDAAMYALANSSKYRILNGNPRRGSQSSPWRSNTSLSSNNSSIYSGCTMSTSSSCTSPWRSNTSLSGNNSSIYSGCTMSTSSSCSNGEGSTVVNVGPLSLLEEGYGLRSLNLGMCSRLSAPAVQAVCDAFPGLHTCPERHSLIISGCLNLTSVHCSCVVEARKDRRFS